MKGRRQGAGGGGKGERGAWRKREGGRRLRRNPVVWPDTGGTKSESKIKSNKE